MRFSQLRILRRCCALVLVLTLATALTGCDNGSDSPPSGSMMPRSIIHDGMARQYFVHLPPRFGEPLPVVIALHGYTSTATGFEAAHSLNPHADANGYIVVYPQGSHFVDAASDAPYRVTSWNDLASNGPEKDAGPHCVDGAVRYPCPPGCGTCDRCDWTACADDLGFVDRVIEAVHNEFPTDPDRTYLLGVSNGGMMALTLGCRLSDRFAAVAPIIGQLAPGYDCGPSTYLPMLHLYGGLDDTVRADGQPGADGFRYTSARQTAATWAEALQCRNGPVAWSSAETDAAGLRCEAWTECGERLPGVTSCMAPDGRHDWPAQRIASIPATCVTDLQADAMPENELCPADRPPPVTAGMDVVWAFFNLHVRHAGN